MEELKLLGRKAILKDPIIRVWELFDITYNLTGVELSILGYNVEDKKYQLSAYLPSSNPIYQNDSAFNDRIDLTLARNEFKLIE